MKKIKSAFVLLLIFAGIGIVTGGCRKEADSKKFTGPKESLIIGTPKIPLSAPVWIAKEMGFFAEEGLEVTLKEYISGKAALEGMLAKEVALAAVAELPILFKSFDRQDFKIMVTFTSSADDLNVITRKNTGIKSGKDLKNKKIGVSLGTNSQFFLDVFLNFHGIENSEVKIIDFKPADLPLALLNQQVDAVVIWEPHNYRAKLLLSDNAVSMANPKIYTETFNLVSSEDFIKKHPEAIKRLLRALDKAIIYIKNHKKESQAIMAKLLNLDLTIIETLWDKFTFNVSLDQSLLNVLEDEARWAIKNKLTDKTKAPNYLNFIYTDGLKAVKPESVNIMR